MQMFCYYQGKVKQNKTEETWVTFDTVVIISHDVYPEGDTLLINTVQLVFQ